MVLNIGAQQTDFYPRPPRGGRPLHALCLLALSQISIHALREEGDRSQAYFSFRRCIISIHALREEGDSPRWFSEGDGCISIHALREEGDDAPRHYPSTTYQFLSTPSARRATTLSSDWIKEGTISIHALREEGDGGR